jgi:hypothetical protein
VIVSEVPARGQSAPLDCPPGAELRLEPLDDLPEIELRTQIIAPTARTTSAMMHPADIVFRSDFCASISFDLLPSAVSPNRRSGPALGRHLSAQRVRLSRGHTLQDQSVESIDAL